jgi:DNA-binding transcriptional regulator YiaG
MPKTVFYTVAKEDKSWIDPEPGNGPFYTVHYIKKTRKDPINNRQRVFMEEVNSDPVTKYLYTRDAEQLSYARRLSRQPKWINKTWEETLKYVRQNWDNSAEPVMVGKRFNYGGQEEGYSGKMTFRDQLNRVRKAHAQAANAPSGAGSSRRNWRERAQQHASVESKAEEGDYNLKMFSDDVVEQIKQARNARELSQKDLALLVNCPVADITKLEKGELAYDGSFKELLFRTLELN